MSGGLSAKSCVVSVTILSPTNVLPSLEFTIRGCFRKKHRPVKRVNIGARPVCFRVPIDDFGSVERSGALGCGVRWPVDLVGSDVEGVLLLVTFKALSTYDRRAIAISCRRCPGTFEGPVGNFERFFTPNVSQIERRCPCPCNSLAGRCVR